MTLRVRQKYKQKVKTETNVLDLGKKKILPAQKLYIICKRFKPKSRAVPLAHTATG